MTVHNNKTQKLRVRVPLLTRSYDDGVVVYNEISAETHLLCADAGLVLGVILSGPTDFPALLATFPELIRGEADFEKRIQEYISEFERLGLVDMQGVD